jgi:hypothetical protein
VIGGLVEQHQVHRGRQLGGEPHAARPWSTASTRASSS